MPFKNIDKRRGTAKKVQAIRNGRKKRTMTGMFKYIVTTLCLTLAAFQLFCAGFGLIDDSVIIGVHLSFIMLLIFLIFPATKSSILTRPSGFDIFLGLLSFSTVIYTVIFATKINQQLGIPTQLDLIMGGICILLVLEAARRTIGKAMPLVAIAFIVYALLGRYIPGAFRHVGFNFKKIIKILYLTDEGIFGTALSTSATYVILFVFFGAIMSEIGMSKFLNNFALAMAGKSQGGPAKVAAIASGLMGTISGSTSGNVATTGVMTIPLMKSVGYKPEYAGAVECVSSAGGQVMPPVMGAAAFLMAQFIGVNYSTIVLAAIIPALLYYLSVIISVDLRARNNRLNTLKKDQIPRMKHTLQNYGHMMIPLLSLIYFLAIKGFSPIYSAWLSIILAVLVSFFKKSSRLNLKRFCNALESGVNSALPVAIACACAGIVIGIISLTGFGLVFANNIFRLSGGNVVFALFFSMIASIVLGMGLPTTACYIVTSLTLAPAVINMGIPVLSAHFFVFYFAIMSTITPPVALSSFVAAGIADSDPVKTGLSAFKLAISGFIIPFMIALKPELLINGYSASAVIISTLTSIIGVILLSIISENYIFSKLRKGETGILIICVAGILYNNFIFQMIAIAVSIVVIASKYFRNRRNNPHSQSPSIEQG